MAKQEQPEDHKDENPGQQTNQEGAEQEKRDPWATFRFERYRGLERRIVLPSMEEAKPDEQTGDCQDENQNE